MYIDGFCMVADATATHSGAFHRLLPGLLIAGLAVVALQMLLAWLRRKSCRRRSRYNGGERLIYLVTVVSVAALGITAFVALLSFGELAGWWLFAHMIAAGALVAALPLLAILWAPAARFAVTREDAERVAVETPPRFFGWAKVMFWIMIAGGLLVTTTMLLSMLPLFGTDGLYTLLDMHRYAGLVVVLATAFHLVSIVSRPVEPA